MFLVKRSEKIADEWHQLLLDLIVRSIGMLIMITFAKYTIRRFWTYNSLTNLIFEVVMQLLFLQGKNTIDFKITLLARTTFPCGFKCGCPHKILDIRTIRIVNT